MQNDISKVTTENATLQFKLVYSYVNAINIVIY